MMSMMTALAMARLSVDAWKLPCYVAGTPQQGDCIAMATCPSQDKEELLCNVCYLTNVFGDYGVCCSKNDSSGQHYEPPLANANKAEDASLVVEGAGKSANVEVSHTALTTAQDSAVKTEAATEQLEKELFEQGFFTKPGTPEAGHNKVVEANPEAILASRYASLALATTNNLDVAKAGTSRFSIAGSPSGQVCPRTSARSCTPSEYYSVDGSCNNLNFPDWGKPLRAFQRLMPPQYADGTNSPRVATDGSPLPSTRLVSTKVVSHKHIELKDVTLMLMAFGQFVDHDLTLTPQVSGFNGAGVVCCDPRLNKDQIHPACFPISVPANDPFYSRFKQTCLEFVRSLPAPDPDCTLGPRNQMSQVTSWMDASQVYGSTHAVADDLRSHVNGKLRVSFGQPGREFPPDGRFPGCSTDANSLLVCFKAGDIRALENPMIATLQVIFLREHNRLADQLLQLNLTWDDQTVFDEARRIVIAEWQHITYNEFLPLVVGREIVKKFDLKLRRQGFWNEYDDTLDATILNEFAAAAYRFGHSAIPPWISLFKGSKNVGNQLLRKHFLNAYLGNLTDQYVSGLTQQASMSIDNQMTEEVTEHLFEQPNDGFGLDLAAFNMQRGRDHGIGTYTQAREACGLPPVTRFGQLNSIMYPGVGEKLQSLFKSVVDVDLWLGGVSELPLPRAVVGPTFACIIAEQFRRLRKGDQLWYERGPDVGAKFSELQLAEVRKTSMARLLCDNSDIGQVQPLVFLKSTNRWNKVVKCDQTASIPSLSLLPFKE